RLGVGLFPSFPCLLDLPGFRSARCAADAPRRFHERALPRLHAASAGRLRALELVAALTSVGRPLCCRCFALVFASALALSLMPPTIALRLPGADAISFRTPTYFGYTVAPWFREYARFGVLCSLSIAVLAGFGLADALDRWPARRSLLLGLVTV